MLMANASMASNVILLLMVMALLPVVLLVCLVLILVCHTHLHISLVPLPPIHHHMLPLLVTWVEHAVWIMRRGL